MGKISQVLIYIIILYCTFACTPKTHQENAAAKNVEILKDTSCCSVRSSSDNSRFFAIFKRQQENNTPHANLIDEPNHPKDKTNISFYKLYFVITFPLFLMTIAFVGISFYKKRNNRDLSAIISCNTTKSAKNDIVLHEEPMGGSLEDINKHDEPMKADNVSSSFACDNIWNIVGASVIGSGHVSMRLPCQDHCGYKDLGSGWGIVVSSDGAGSADHSDIGSKTIVDEGIRLFESLITQKHWQDNEFLPADDEWVSTAYETLRSLRDLVLKSEKEGVDNNSLNATVIVLIHTPYGLLATHIGDGRCGYRDNEGNWLPIIKPHKGEVANETIFLLSNFWDIPNFVMSGVLVPESRVIRGRVSGFTLMSDGCESTAWLCNQYDVDRGVYHDPNKPFDRFFNPIVSTLCTMHEQSTPMSERKKAWEIFIHEYGNFAKEQDDKTLIVGILNN